MKPNIQGILKNRILLLACIVLVVIVGVSSALTYYINQISYEVVLNDNGHIVQIVTMEKNVGKLLDKYNISLGAEDKIQPGLEEEITNDTNIQIERAFKVNVAVDGKLDDVYITKGTVEDVLKKAGIKMGDKDFTNYSLEQLVGPGTLIKVTRIEEEIMVESDTVPYEEVTRNNNNMIQGVEKVVQEGKQGEIQKKILVAYQDGVEISRTLIEEEVVQEPVNRIIEKGTAKPVTKSSTQEKNKVQQPKQSTEVSRGNVERGSAAVTFNATAYTHTGNKTRTGIWPKQGIISVDPGVIPLHSTVYIEFPKGWEHLNGSYKAMDTGGAIKGNKVDIFLDSEELCRQFGRKSVKIYLTK